VLDLEKALATGESATWYAESVRQMLEERPAGEGPLAESFAEPTATRRHSTPRHIRWPAEPSRKSLRHGTRGVVPPSASTKTSVASLRLRWSHGHQRIPARRQPAAFMYMAAPSWRISSITSAVNSSGIGPQSVSSATGARLWFSPSLCRLGRRAGRTRRSSSRRTWHLDGVKRSSPTAIRRPVREQPALSAGSTGSAGPGTTGLSLLIVPRYLFDPETGELGDRNGVYVTGLEHKMGLKPLQQRLTFGQHGVPAVGWLVNDTHNGIARCSR